MAALFIILLASVGLFVRARVHRRLWSVNDVEAGDETGLVETCARAFVLVLISLVGLLALGVLYGNVLGPAAGTP